MIHRESLEQQALFQWVQLNIKKYPELELLYHIPNGGKRNVREGARLKKEGVKAGVPDIHLPIPRGMYYSLWIELKVKGNKTSANQEKWISKLRGYGHEVAVCYGWEEAKNAIEKYLDINQHFKP